MEPNKKVFFLLFLPARKGGLTILVEKPEKGGGDTEDRSWPRTWLHWTCFLQEFCRCPANMKATTLREELVFLRIGRSVARCARRAGFQLTSNAKEGGAIFRPPEVWVAGSGWS